MLINGLATYVAILKGLSYVYFTNGHVPYKQKY